VTKLNPTLSGLVYSTYLGGNNYDSAFGIGVDSLGDAVVAGSTGSSNFPTLNPIQNALNGSRNAFMAELNPSGTGLLFSAYLGGNNFDQPDGAAVDPLGNLYAAGQTQSTNFPTTTGAFQTTWPGGELHAFVAKIGLQPPPCSASTSIAQNFNGTPIPGNSYIWFNANFQVSSGQPVNGTTVQLAGGSVSFTANNTNYTAAVPNSLTTFSSSATCASVSFDTANQQWNVTVPLSGSDEIFLSGLAFPVPASGLPGGIKNVIWPGTMATSTPGLDFQWKCGAAVYSSFSTDYNSLGVKPTHQNACAYNNGDHAGTPENFKSVIGGATGGGGSNFTGSWSGTVTVAPVCPAQ
jgi:beta-propeller repeat-containing protein